MYLVINKCVTAVKVSNFSCHYLRNRSTLDIGILGYIGIVKHKEHSPEVSHIPPGTLCIFTTVQPRETLVYQNPVYGERNVSRGAETWFHSYGTPTEVPNTCRYSLPTTVVIRGRRPSRKAGDFLHFSSR